MCSLPLEVGIDRFGTDNHTVAVSVVDIFGQGLDLFFVFRLVEREFDVYTTKYIYFNCSN